MNQGDPKIKLQFMPLLSTMMAKLLGFRNAFPEVEIEEDENSKDIHTNQIKQTSEIRLCILCQSPESNHALTTYIIRHRQV